MGKREHDSGMLTVKICASIIGGAKLDHGRASIELCSCVGGDYAMTSHGTIPGQPHLETETAVPLFAQALRPCCVAPEAHARCAAAAVAAL
jgi:hypothetical protein